MSARRAKTASPSSPPATSAALREWWAVLALCLATVAVYFPALDGDFQWDDRDQFAGLRQIQEPGGIVLAWTELNPKAQYYPLSHSLFWAVYQLFGPWPPAFHVTNLALHLGNVLLVYVLCRQISPRWALWGAALFALHPVSVAAVAWMCQLRNDLSVHLALWTAWWWMRFEASSRRGWQVAATLTFVAALLAKTAVAPLPVVLGLVWGRIRPDPRRWLRLAPLFVAALGLSLVTVFHEDPAGAERQVADPWPLRIARAGWIAWYYLFQLAWPPATSFVHVRWPIDPSHGTAYVPTLAGLALLAVVTWSDRRRGTWWGTALWCYLALLFPVLGFINVFFMRYAWVADHWHYPALVVAAGALVAGLERLDVRWALPRWAPLLVALPALFWGGVSARVIPQYENQERMWRATLEHNPENWLVRNNLGAILLGAGQLDEAAVHLARALELNPREPRTSYNLGQLAEHRGELAAAEKWYLRAAELQPRWATPKVGLVGVSLKQGQLALAETQARSTVAEHPSVPLAWSALGDVCRAGQKLTEAQAAYERAHELAPQARDAEYQLAGFLLATGQAPAALPHFESLLARDPRDALARFGLASTLEALGQVDLAIGEYRRLLADDPNHLAAANNLAVALSSYAVRSPAERQEAVRLSRRVSAAQGDRNPQALETLFMIAAAAGERHLARETAQRLLALLATAPDPARAERVRRRLAELEAGGR